jgi:branched-chain amino acid transport system permease protein
MSRPAHPTGTPAAAAQRLWEVGALLGLTAALALAAASASPVLERVATTMLINLVVVVGLYVFIGNSGVLSFGHTSFMAIGAYAAALVTIPRVAKEFLLPELPAFLARTELAPVIATLAGASLAAGVAAVLAVPLMRMSELAASLATFALLLLVDIVARNWDAVTRGGSGLASVPTWVDVPVALAGALLAVLLAFAYQQTSTAFRLRATREDPVAAQALGVSLWRTRTVAWVLSAFVVGLGGALYAQSAGAFTPDAFSFVATFTTLTMLVAGGTRSLTGAVIGTIAISALLEVLRRAEQGVALGPLSWGERPGLQETGLAVALLLMLMLRPAGLTGGREVPWPFRRGGAR